MQTVVLSLCDGSCGADAPRTLAPACCCHPEQENIIIDGCFMLDIALSFFTVQVRTPCSLTNGVFKFQVVRGWIGAPRV